MEFSLLHFVSSIHLINFLYISYIYQTYFIYFFNRNRRLSMKLFIIYCCYLVEKKSNLDKYR
ncbi:hypothetical protein GLOIN_2v1712598 [Rhizophagus irregularis DAOM 181602=DAOM 197198]|uniref:Uncharacterized protein n=1 Tax=Rhizophagus irregularis (strain DAOM 181602 / DAOM 197198 / MUCL 43194) TaxID=747089 RepID=A0A2P4P535_RHIID|nr:hypothetical protein GLOIN_2v1712598 [Rhizophagus irregularis DAOM 181602=DAOM 197198]POG60499.1 hypothetical protein GLOIN_2v1712598 [Rhizophagus irregularis DAOM 181602=DAOM 197198]|eukprot:XP_025167365.1 hypothetical protein GLOIN_2v1712598 [Rhizophagus irregularis DAOM 181602=DAOM 197198]